MKKILFIMVICFYCNEISAQLKQECIAELASYYNISAKTVGNWKKDKNGCLGLRRIDSTAELTAMPRKIFLVIFGKPDTEHKESVENNQFITYYYRSVVTCKLSKPTTESDISTMVFIFKNDRLFKEVLTVE